MSSLAPLFAPTSVAIVGDSPTGGRGAMMRDHLRRLGYPGPVYSVNPKYSEIAGNPCYPSLEEIGADVDCVLVAVGARRAVETVGQAGALGARSAVVIASGFAEAGPDGVALQGEFVQVVRDNGMAVCGPNCYGVIDFHGPFAGYGGPVPHSIQPGNVALLLQSGALSHAILNPSSRRGLRLSRMVTTGNEAVVQLGAYVLAAVEDPNTTVIGCFIEGVRDRAAFTDAVVAARDAGKPVVVCKTGRTEGSRAAAVAHTGALVGDDAAFDALCEATGMIRVDDLDQLIEVCLLLSDMRVPRSPVAITSISGGGSGVMADLAGAEGLALAELGAETAAALREVLPTFANVGNPLDLTGAVGEDPTLVPRSMQVLDRAPEIGTVAIALNAPTADNPLEKHMYAGMLQGAISGAGSGHLVAFTMTSGDMDDSLLSVAREAGVPLLMGMREAIAALGRASRAHERQRSWRRPSRAPGTASGLVAMSEARSSELLAAAGLRFPRRVVVDTPEDAARAAADIGYPVAVKVESSEIPHKTEAGCVALDLPDEEAVVSAAQRILKIAADLTVHEAPRLMVAEMVPPGTDLLVGAVAEPDIGHVLVVGHGGLLAELMPPRRLLAPATAAEVDGLLRHGALGRVLQGYRGGAAADLGAVVQAVAALSEWLTDHPEVQQVDINPLRVLPAGQGYLALDALVVTGTD